MNVLRVLNEAAGHTSLRDKSPMYAIGVKSGKHQLQLVTPIKGGSCDVKPLTGFVSSSEAVAAAWDRVRTIAAGWPTTD